mgnify:CR=1 FL=1
MGQEAWNYIKQKSKFFFCDLKYLSIEICVNVISVIGVVVVLVLLALAIPMLLLADKLTELIDV